MRPEHDVIERGAVDQQQQQQGVEPLVPLLEAMREGGAAHQSAMPIFINYVQRPVRTLLRRRAERYGFDASFVDDVVQEALTRIVVSAHRCAATSDRGAIAWVLQVAHSAWCDTLRREGPRGVSLDDQTVMVETEHSFEESCGRRPLAAPGHEILLRAAVGVMLTLSDEDMALLWLRIIAGEEWAIIGSTLCISATAARRRYQRAQHTMRRKVWEALATLPDCQQLLARTWLLERIEFLSARLGD